MKGQEAIIHIAINPVLALTGTGLLVFWFVFRKSFQQGPAGSAANSPETGWYVPVVDSHAVGNSFFHDWDVRFKCSALFIYFFCIAFLKTPVTAGIALLYSFLTLFVGHLSLLKALKRLKAMLPFLSMFLVIMPLTARSHPGDVMLLVDPIPWAFNLRGFWLALTIVFKAAAIALLMEPLFNTAPLSVTVNGLQKIGVPAQICQMLLMAHRYIFVLLHEAKRMSIAMKVRGFRKKTDLETLRVMGNFVGMLMVRSIDRTERVYEAMLARGYQGTFPTYHEYKSVPMDWYKTAALVAIGIAFLVFDWSIG